MPVAYVDPDTQEILSYPGEDDFLDVAYDQEVQSSQASQQQVPPPKDMHQPVCLGFEPPPEEPTPGVRARKSRGRKMAMRAIGADG
jgi:hypothetical protein